MSDTFSLPPEDDPDLVTDDLDVPDHEMEVLEDDPSVPPRPEEEIADAAEEPVDVPVAQPPDDGPPELTES